MSTLAARLGAVALLALAASAAGVGGVAAAQPTPETCTEDMACWDCATMGNEQCGPLLPDTAAPTPAPELGATVNAAVYIDEGRAYSVWNRSNVETHVALHVADGWAVTPAVLTLAPDETAAVQTTGTGADGAELQVRMTATAPTPPGEQASELLLASRLYLEPPAAGMPAWVLPAVAAVLLALSLVIVAVARRRWA